MSFAKKPCLVSVQTWPSLFRMCNCWFCHFYVKHLLQLGAEGGKPRVMACFPLTWVLDGLQPPREYVRCRLSALDFAVTSADRPGLFASFALSRRTKPPPYITQAHGHIKPCIKANIKLQLFPLEITFNNSTATISCEGLFVALTLSRFQISGKLPLD